MAIYLMLGLLKKQVGHFSSIDLIFNDVLLFTSTSYEMQPIGAEHFMSAWKLLAALSYQGSL